MDNLEIIESLKQDLPKTEAIIGYGSGIYKQTGYNPEEKPDKDVIVVVDDFKDFLIEDFKENFNHFSDDFDKNILLRKKKKDNFYSNVGCLKFYHAGYNFKAMVISKKALEEDMRTWKYFGMAGRLTKPILYQNIPEELEEAIQINREKILITALLLNQKDRLTLCELYNTISQLTYMYDFRTLLPGEKKSKASDIVRGAYDFFDETYGQSDILSVKKGVVQNPHPIEQIYFLPENLKRYIINNLTHYDYDRESIKEVSKVIYKYFRKTNLPNSIKLAISSSTTLGKKETIKHGLRKFKRHFQK